MWRIEDISFELVDDMTSDPVVTAVVVTPAGRLIFMAEPRIAGLILELRGTHVHGAQRNAVGAGNLLMLAQAVMERMGYDGIVVKGALRTTGANPGHRPRDLRFTRRARPELALG
jgi:hypothetical protein